MGVFRKKPVEIEAVQWDGNVLVGGAPDWLAAVGEDHDEPPTCVQPGTVAFCGENLFIGTLEGTHRADPGDWIIKGVKGELYPCKPDIFEATYDAVPPKNRTLDESLQLA